jgi:hypothetical protein
MNLSKLEPVRLYVYGLVQPIALAIIGFGIYDSQRVMWIAGIVLAVLTVPAAEAARQKVIPAQKTVLTGNIVNDARAQLEQAAGMIRTEIQNSIPGMLAEASRSANQLRAPQAQMPDMTYPSGKVDPVPNTPTATENPYA